MKKYFLLLLTLFLFAEFIKAHDNVSFGGKFKVELFLGYSLKEMCHVGFLIGDKVSIGGYAGIGPTYAGSGYSLGLNIKDYFSKTKTGRSKGFMRFAYGVWMYDYSEIFDPELQYYALTIGRDFYITSSFGISLEGGFMYNNSLAKALLPAISFKCFYHFNR